jgi:hypothetical protein
MKNWKMLLWLLGGLLMLAALVLYLGQVTSCYPPAAIWKKFTIDQMTAFVEACRLKASPASRFADFLSLSVPGVILFTTYWLILPPRVKIQRNAVLAIALILMMLVCLFVTLTGMLAYPVPGNPTPSAAWVGEAIAALGFLGYLGLLALWRWKRWGGILFQVAAIALAAFLLLAGGSRLLSGILVLGVVIVALLVRPFRHKLV